MGRYFRWKRRWTTSRPSPSLPTRPNCSVRAAPCRVPRKAGASAGDRGRTSGRSGRSDGRRPEGRPGVQHLENRSKDDVDYRRAQDRADQGTWPRHGRHRFARSPGRDPHRAHQQPDPAFQEPREGQPLAPRPADDGQQAPLAARLSPPRRTSSATPISSRSSASASNSKRPLCGPLRICVSPAIRRGARPWGLMLRRPEPQQAGLPATAEPGRHPAARAKETKCSISKL